MPHVLQMWMSAPSTMIRAEKTPGAVSILLAVSPASVSMDMSLRTTPVLVRVNFAQVSTSAFSDGLVRITPYAHLMCH